MRARWIGWVALGMAVAGAGALLSGPPAWLLDWLAARYPGCLYRVPVQAPVVALTVDDGPDTATTPRILDELRRHGARATFFLIAERVAGRERLVHRLVAEGHEVGNHFTRDRPGIRLAAGQFERDLEEAHQALAPYGRARWARPGSGWYSQAMIATMARHGYRCALGSVYPYDAAIPSPAFARWHILRNARPGAILVLHDSGARGRRTARVLRAVLPELHRRGFRVVSLSELVAMSRSP
ncbi:MAG TPA: polysaccharide deacetylase family protein [Gemmatimonadales bacterium]|nr:polysaccharide deacetylase family protein [Gemmatimonadales bacterium]